MALSDAVGLERISRIVGYKLTKGDFSDSTPNLPQRIAILGQANVANQGSLSTDPYRILSARDAGERYGYGSPIHIVSRILFPVTGGGTIGGIPVIVYPQADPIGASRQAFTVEVNGVAATASGTHFVVIGGRYSVDGGSYAINITKGDTATQIAVRIANVVNNVLGAPVTAANTSPASTITTLTSKWAGATAAELTVEIDTNGLDLGFTYAVTPTTSGTGTPTITSSLAMFGEQWNTIVINTYGFNTQIIEALQSFNGIPDPVVPTGRYSGIIWKPLIALTGTVEDCTTSSTDVLVCDSNKTEVTIAGCPAPNSKGLPMEAAANMCTLYARIAQDNPQLDVAGKSYPDMPTATTFEMQSYDVRDAVVQMGMSTVNLVAGKYQVQDFVTTYHPDGEIPPQFRFVRNLNIDFNVRYGYYLLEQINCVDKALVNDADIVTVSNIVKPKQWKAIVQQYAENLSQRALIADFPFMQDSVTVQISSINPDRFETFFRYKRSGFLRIASTTAEAGFNFGNA